MPQKPSIDELISLKEAVELSGLSDGHLRYLVRTGKIWGQKIGRNWVTTNAELQKYLAKERKPGPKA